MTPIPLSSPDGTVRAYACGRCERLGRGGIAPLRGADPNVHRVEGERESYHAAWWCCRCTTCKAAGEIWPRTMCAACHKAEEERHKAEIAEGLALDGLRPCPEEGCYGAGECPTCEGSGVVPL